LRLVRLPYNATDIRPRRVDRRIGHSHRDASKRRIAANAGWRRLQL